MKIRFQHLAGEVLKYFTCKHNWLIAVTSYHTSTVILEFIDQFLIWRIKCAQIKEESQYTILGGYWLAAHEW
jgi:hypothetical protein